MSWLREELATLALCWRIERVDGVAIGLTAHDRDLAIDGVVYRAAPGMVPSAVVRESGLDADTGDVGGALTSSALSARDLAAGRWDGARVVLSAVDWTDVANRVPLQEGTIGAVEVTDGGFVAELTGAALDRPVDEETAPMCRARLGDARCRVPMAARRWFARVVAVDGAVVTVDRVGDWAGGSLRWFGGANSGLRGTVATAGGAVLTLSEAPPFSAAAGDLVELTEGCDRTIATCAGRFGNAANFRGEPHLPGIDLVTRWIGG